MARVDTQWSVTWQGTEDFSVDVISLFVPDPAISQSARMLGITPDDVPNLGGEAFLSWVLLAGVAATMLFNWRRVPKLWLVMGGFFLILALGPTLTVAGHRSLIGLLPYRWLFEFVPLLTFARTPMRFATVAQLCLAVYAAQGIASWMSSRKDKPPTPVFRRTLLIAGGVALCGVLYLESTGGSMLTFGLEVPAVYEEVNDRDNIHAIFEGPISSGSKMCNLYMYFQTFHGKKVANGYLTHPSRTARTLIDQLTSGEAVDSADRLRLARAGIDAMVYHDAPLSGYLIPLR